MALRSSFLIPLDCVDVGDKVEWVWAIVAVAVPNAVVVVVDKAEDEWWRRLLPRLPLLLVLDEEVERDDVLREVIEFTQQLDLGGNGGGVILDECRGGGGGGWSKMSTAWVELSMDK